MQSGIDLTYVLTVYHTALTTERVKAKREAQTVIKFRVLFPQGRRGGSPFMQTTVEPSSPSISLIDEDIL